MGQSFELFQAAFKRYPTGGPTQPAVQALLEMRKQVRPKEVTRILIEMPDRGDASRSAKMPALNLPYIASLIMLDGRLDFTDVQSLDRMRDDAELAAFSKLVEVAEDKAQEAGEAEARVESEQRGSPTLVKFVPFVTGFPSHPMGRAELEDKALELMMPALGKTRSLDVIARAGALDDEHSVESIIALIAR